MAQKAKESDLDEEITSQAEQKEGGRPEELEEENTGGKVKYEGEENLNENEQKALKRCGQRSPNKPDYNGRNIMVAQLSPAKETGEKEVT